MFELKKLAYIRKLNDSPSSNEPTYSSFDLQDSLKKGKSPLYNDLMMEAVNKSNDRSSPNQYEPKQRVKT